MNAHDDKRKGLDAQDRAIWGAFTQSVRPLTPRSPGPLTRPARPARAPVAPSATPAAPLRKAAPQVEAIERRQKQQLARGRVEIDARLDLHGKTQAQAHAELMRFLRQAQSQGAKFVLVITGKGALARDHGGEPGVLRRQVPLWLRQPELRSCVSAFEQAHVVHGGEGALYVRLRRLRNAD
jgi:DNA-nicking Smr family endonuclease